MPNLLYLSGALTVKIDYLWQKHSKGPYYYRRRVPKDIAPRIGDGWRQVALKTYDMMAAAKMIDRFTLLDTERASLRSYSGPTITVYFIKQGTGGGAQQELGI